MRKGLSYSEAGKLGAIKSAKSQQKQKKKRIDNYNLDPSLCEYCNKPLLYEKRKNKFCNHSCAASFNNIGTVRHGKLRKKECINCKKITKNEKYCSNKCHKEFEWNIYKKKIEQKKEINSIRVAKKYLIETIGNKCSICGLEEWMGKSIVMITDHINGNPEDNFLKTMEEVEIEKEKLDAAKEALVDEEKNYKKIEKELQDKIKGLEAEIEVLNNKRKRKNRS